MATLLFFGRLGDRFHTQEYDVSATDTVNDLRETLDRTLGAEGTLLAATVQVAVDGELVEGTSPVSYAKEIAFLPPVGGG